MKQFQLKFIPYSLAIEGHISAFEQYTLKLDTNNNALPLFHLNNIKIRSIINTKYVLFTEI